MQADRGCVLVTGATRGIGAAIARSLAADGRPVAVNFRADGERATALVEELETTSASAVAIQADVSRQEDVERLFARLETQHGHVSVLVNNAGVRVDRLTPQMKDDDWERVLDTNLTGAFRVSRRAVMAMVRARFGRIINVASVVGPNIGNPGQSNYASAKAGLVGLTRSMAREVAHRGVTVNAVAPGFVATDMIADLDPSILSAIPTRRAAVPQEIAAAVRFLASEDASYVTGTVLTVDGGLTA